MSVKARIISTLLWGFILWLIGYIAGMLLFFVVPKNYIGWIITPFATVLTVLVLIKKIKRPQLFCYVGLGVLWTIMAVGLDYLFIVKMLHTENIYYKPDVYLYYFLTLLLPILVGYWKYTHKSSKAPLF